MSPKLSIIGHGKHGRYLGSILKELDVTPVNLITTLNFDQLPEAIKNSDHLIISSPPETHNEYISEAINSHHVRRIYLEKPFKLSPAITNQLYGSNIEVLTGLWFRETEIHSLLSNNLSEYNYVSVHHSHDWQIRNPCVHEGIAERLLIHFYDLILCHSSDRVKSHSYIVDSNNFCMQMQLENKSNTLIHIFLSYSSYPHSKITASTNDEKIILDNGQLFRYSKPNIINEKGVASSIPFSSNSCDSFSDLMRASTRLRLKRFLYKDIDTNDLPTALAAEKKLISLLSSQKYF